MLTGELPTVKLLEAAPATVASADAVALPVLPGDNGAVLLGPGGVEFVEAFDVDALGLLEHATAKGKVGELVEHLVSLDGRILQVLFVGVGEAAPDDLRKAGAVVARRTRGRSCVATSVPAVSDDDGLRAFLEGVVLGTFRYDLKTGDRGPSPAPEFVIASQRPLKSREATVAQALEVARASATARALATVPSNEKSPRWLAERAVEVGHAAGLDVKVWDERRLRDEGFGGILAVGQASANPPRLVRLDYTPPKANRRTKHVVLVGKGITFDTGGLSIKPGELMMNMKRDMTGAGVVLSVMQALGAVGCKVKVTALMACAENSVGGNSLRPGDVIRHYGGRTTEVTNTDAEGRLVMADALAYAVSDIKPDALVDVATLTGAIKVSLGLRTAGLFASNDALASTFLRAAGESGEPFWRMPLVDDYLEGLKSDVADADNAGPGPGAILAALYLRPFTGGLPWLHLDIASVGDSSVDAFEWTPGPTGFGARALLRWLGSDTPLAGV